jgi:uncharacterized metal-binding protein
MNCLDCKSKDCKFSSKDCNGLQEIITAEYKKSGSVPLYENADKLVAGGRAGSLSKLDEIIEFSKLQKYRTAGIAYCFSMEKEAALVMERLKDAGIKVQSFRCTINGIKETAVSCSMSGGVNCNPIGQAEAVNRSRSELVIEMGLCLGHDILFHSYLKKPFTVFAVKDRVHNNNPLAALQKD